MQKFAVPNVPLAAPIDTAAPLGPPPLFASLLDIRVISSAALSFLGVLVLDPAQSAFGQFPQIVHFVGIVDPLYETVAEVLATAVVFSFLGVVVIQDIAFALPIVLVSSVPFPLYYPIFSEFLAGGLVYPLDAGEHILDHVEVLLPFRIPVLSLVVPPRPLLPQILAAASVAVVAVAVAAAPLTAVYQDFLATLCL